MRFDSRLWSYLGAYSLVENSSVATIAYEAGQRAFTLTLKRQELRVRSRNVLEGIDFYRDKIDEIRRQRYRRIARVH